MNSESFKRFIDITIEDPLFAAEGLDLDNALSAVAALERTTVALQNFWQKSYRGFCFWYPFSKTLHPFDFLKCFFESERIRRSFLNFPNENMAGELIKWHKKTADALYSDLIAFRDAIIALQKMEKVASENSILYFHSSAVSLGEFIESIELMIENSLELRREVTARSELLVSSSAEPIQSKKTAMPIPRRDSGPELSLEYKFMLELEKKNSPPIVERYGPIYYEFPHLNGFPEVHAFYVSIVKGPYPGIKYLSASLADRRYFMKLKETSEEFSAERNKFDNRNMTIYEPLMKRGIFYWHQSVTSFYSVLDLAYYADLATVVDCYKRRPFLPRKAVLTQKSSLLDLILWNCWTHERVYLKMTEVQAKAGRLPSPLYSFIARSYPSLLYLPFNSSVWRTEKPAHFLGTRFGKGGIYKEFEEIKAELPTDKLEEIFKGRILRQEDWGKYD